MIDLQRTKEIFQALSLHFSSNYDYTRYNGKARTAPFSKDELWFKIIGGKLKTEERVYEFFLANHVSFYLQERKVCKFSGSFASKEAFEVWEDWKNRINKLSHIFQEELKGKDFKALLEVNGNHPKIFVDFLHKKISAETICCIFAAMPSTPKYWLKNSNDPILLPEYCRFFTKYRMLLDINEGNIKKAIKELNEKE